MTNCNIIIPTFNRPHFLRRILDYYSKQGSDFKIIVADSSLEENKKINKKIISSFPDLNIQHLDNYPPQINWYQKYGDSLNYAQEEYCLFCADDDFITPRGINKSVNFLKNNPDFTVAHGRYIGFFVKPGKKGEKRLCWKFSYSGQSITFPDPALRLTEHLSKYSQLTTYGVHQTDFLKMIFKEAIKYAKDNQFGEILPSALTLIYGKMKCLDVFYGAQEIIHNSLGKTSKTIHSFIRKGSYNEKYNEFKNCLAAHLSKESQLNIEESKKIIDNAMSEYLKRYAPNDFRHFLRDKVKDIFEFFNLPYSLYEKMRTTYSKLAEDSRGWRDDSPIEYYDDFDKIKTQVITYSKNGK